MFLWTINRFSISIKYNLIISYLERNRRKWAALTAAITIPYRWKNCQNCKINLIHEKIKKRFKSNQRRKRPTGNSDAVLRATIFIFFLLHISSEKSAYCYYTTLYPILFPKRGQNDLLIHEWELEKTKLDPVDLSMEIKRLFNEDSAGFHWL